MGFECGIIGLPNVGKTTIFNALTAAKAEVGIYPFTTINPNIGTVKVPDIRLNKISAIVRPKRVKPAVLEFVDIAGLVKNASKGEGLGNQFLSYIRNIDAIAHVVRCFKDPNVAHIGEDLSPKQNIETVNLELILADLATVEKRIEKIKRLAKGGNKEAKKTLEILLNLKGLLEQGNPLISSIANFNEETKSLIKDIQLLTIKPVMYIANCDEETIVEDNECVKEVKQISQEQGTAMIKICAQMEAELAELPLEERQQFLKEMGLKESGLNQFIYQGYKMLSLITFFTTAGPEVRAWTVKEGTKAPQAARKIHSDIERGFIRVEVIKYEDLIQHGSIQACKESGIVKVEGKDYVIQDGDILYFRFNV
jgi:hypothetical protein